MNKSERDALRGRDLTEAEARNVLDAFDAFEERAQDKKLDVLGDLISELEVWPDSVKVALDEHLENLAAKFLVRAQELTKGL